MSASKRAWPQRRTDALTVCQSQPSTAAVSAIASPRPARRVAQRPARVVNSARCGAMAGSCSLKEPAAHPERGHRQRRLCHACLTVGRQHRRGWLTCAMPHRAPERRQVHQLDAAFALGPHRPPAPPTSRLRPPTPDVHPQRPVRLVVDADDLHIAQSHQQLADARRVALHRDPPVIRLSSQRRFWGIPRVQPRTLKIEAARGGSDGR